MTNKCSVQISDFAIWLLTLFVGQLDLDKLEDPLHIEAAVPVYIYGGKINGDTDGANIEQSASGRWKADICKNASR